jgi:predicted lipoprotein with Yx(FWY)xxD motif
VQLLKATAAYLSVLAVGALALSGCAAGESKQTKSSTAATTDTSVVPRTDAVTPAPNPPPTATALQPIGDASLEIHDRRDLGEILVDGSKRTLYAFSNDRPNDPTCYDSCALTYMPLFSKSDPAGGVGIDDASTGTVERRDGRKQATYKGIPLYLYAGDHIDSDANGQGLDLFGGEWSVLTKDGRPLT